VRNSVKVVASLAVLALGCGDKKAEECKQVVSIVNASSDSPGKLRVAADAGSVEATAEVVSVANKMEKGLSAASVTTPELKAVVSGYQTMTRAIGQASTDMKGAFSEAAALNATAPTDQLATARKDLHAARVKLVDYCTKKPTGDCIKVNLEVPTDIKAADYATKLGQVAEAFQKAQWKDKSVAELVGGWAKAAGVALKVAAEVNKVREKVAGLEDKALQAHAAILQASQQSNGLTMALNKACRP
jgi:hypothetical protein